MSGEAVRGSILFHLTQQKRFQSPMSGEAVRGIKSISKVYRRDWFQSPMSGEAVRGRGF